MFSEKPEMPIEKHINVRRFEGRYNLLDSSEESVQYTFYFPELTDEKYKELGLRSYFTVDIEKDYISEDYTALEVASAIKEIYESYWYAGSLPAITKLVDYLESVEEEQEALRLEYAIQVAKLNADYWLNETLRLQAIYMNHYQGAEEEEGEAE